MKTRALVWLSGALLALVLLGWLWPLLRGESLFWGLPALQFYPWRSYAFELIRAGDIPLWNPYNGGGAPLLANYQTAVLYPPNWLHLILSDVAAMNVLAVGHIAWAAAGMWLFMRCWRVPDFGCAVSALTFALSGYLIARLGSFPTTAAASWLPWVFWAVHRLIVFRKLRDMATLSLSVAMLLLAGHAQTAYYILLGAAAYSLWLGWNQARGRIRWAVWASCALAVGLGATMAAAQLLPTAQLLLRSARGNGLDYDWITNFSYSLPRALTLFIPNLYGTPADGSYITEGVYFEDAAYIGLLPIIGAIFGVIQWLRSRGQELPGQPPAMGLVPFALAMAGISFLIALGKNGFLFPFLYRSVPTFTAFQGPVRWLILTVFSLSALAGVGVSYGWHKGKWTVFWSRLICAGGMGMALVAALAAPRLLPDIEAVEVMVRGFVSLGILLSICALLTLFQPDGGESRRRLMWQAAVLLFIALDIFWAFRGLNPTIPAEFYQPVEREQPAGMLYMTEEAEERLKFDVYFTVNDYRVAVERWRDLRVSLLPNLNLLDRVPMANNFDPIVTQDYVEMIARIEASLVSASDIAVLDADTVPRNEPFGQEAFLIGLAITAVSIALLTGFLLLEKSGRFVSVELAARINSKTPV